MRNRKVMKLEVVKSLLEVAKETFPSMECLNPSQCKSCNPSCKTSNILKSALYWVEEILREEEIMESLITVKCKRFPEREAIDCKTCSFRSLPLCSTLEGVQLVFKREREEEEEKIKNLHSHLF